MHEKMLMRFHYTPTGMVKIKNADVSSVGEDGYQLEYLYNGSENSKWYD
jgi:hypothetical protein